MKNNKKYNKIIVASLIFISAAFNFALSQEEPNIVLIIVDCLRADHLGCYGYQRNTSPNIDKLAQEGVLFDNAFSQAGYTLASFPSMLTSKTPLSHGVWRGGERVLDDNEVTLAEVLKKNGYVTAAFTSGGLTSRRFGFSQGFDIYEENKMADIKTINQSVFQWLENKKKKPFFLLIHYYTTHDPFSPPGPFNKMFAGSYHGRLKDAFLGHRLLDETFGKAREEASQGSKEDLNYVISQYDGAIRYCDVHIGSLFKKIEDLGLDSHTIIILTSDHGEDFMEHGTISHKDVYDVNLHIPLIFKIPHELSKGKKVGACVRSIDIFPTILDLSGLSSEGKGEGLSLLPLMSGRPDHAERLIFSVGENINGKPTRIAMRTQDWKLIFSPDAPDTEKYELYDLNNDPQELNTLAAVEKERFSLLKQKLDDYLKQAKPIKKGDMPALDDESKEQLKSLGYIQ